MQQHMHADELLLNGRNASAIDLRCCATAGYESAMYGSLRPWVRMCVRQEKCPPLRRAGAAANHGYRWSPLRLIGADMHFRWWCLRRSCCDEDSSSSIPP
uniref:Uncharacterized protein n=1 Tax=Lotharella oceanica TaxID=641309 RepID=A0A7S2XFL9_9EUKA|mmetsp:Transcript_4536/g.9102  ORF Transcript_4536/g.9102 Transcript_4536/m.9102 type:complete len:100 (+) Transcript_4536:165-464(+)